MNTTETKEKERKKKPSTLKSLLKEFPFLWSIQDERREKPPHEELSLPDDAKVSVERLSARDLNLKPTDVTESSFTGRDYYLILQDSPYPKNAPYYEGWVVTEPYNDSSAPHVSEATRYGNLIVSLFVREMAKRFSEGKQPLELNSIKFLVEVYCKPSPDDLMEHRVFVRKIALDSARFMETLQGFFGKAYEDWRFLDRY